MWVSKFACFIISFILNIFEFFVWIFTIVFKKQIFSVHIPDGVSFVDAAGCVGDAVKAYIALHYMGRLGGSDDTGKHQCFFFFKGYNY